MGTKDVLPKHIVDAHMYDAIYASMEHSLQEAQIREAKYQKGEVIRKKEERLRGMVKLPVGEFYANTRFDHGRGGAEGRLTPLRVHGPAVESFTCLMFVRSPCKSCVCS